jgi:AcrR family transcriptional regulator
MDPRRARSRAALVDAAIALVEERETDEISVTDLARRAGVTRVTLYQCFADRDELLQEAGLARFRATVDDLRAGDPPSFEELVERLLGRLAPQREFYARLLTGSTGRQTYLAVQRFVADSISGSTAVGGRELDPDERLFVGGGTMALLVQWLADGRGADTRAAAARISAIIGRFRPEASR